mmetsp:Transcript_19113/g.31983  ORF Transcript_19113/g.31983 Transcript_19113/m.31983 type:complete len:463 (+) Transcript_19113:311-1699(+)
MSSRVEIPRTPFDFIKAHPNVFQLILEYCISSIDDLKNVGLTNKATYEKTWTHLMASVMGRNNMKLLLRNFGLPYSEFMQALRDSNAVISGSFALQAVMGEKASFSADDIDIYVSSNQNLDILNTFLEDNGYEFVERAVPPGVVPLTNQQWEDEDNIVYHMNPVFASFFKAVRDYKQTTGEGKVQIIEMQEGRLVTQASDMYDMTMVQVLMHPVPVTVTALNDESVGVSRVLEMNDHISFAIKHPADIYNRRLKLNPQWIIAMQTIQGLVSNHNTPVNNMGEISTHRCLEMVYARVRKYVARGFLFEGELPLPRSFHGSNVNNHNWTGDKRTCANYMLLTDAQSLSDDVIIEYFNQNPDMWYQPCLKSRHFSETIWPMHLLCEHYRPKVIKTVLATLPDIVHKSPPTYGRTFDSYLPTVAEYTKTLVKAGIVDVQECVEKTLELEEIRELLKSKVMEADKSG